MRRQAGFSFLPHGRSPKKLLQFGQVSVVGTTGYARLTLMTLPFARQNVGASKNAHPALGACQSEKLELESGSVALRQRLDHQILCAYYLQESRRKCRVARRNLTPGRSQNRA